VVAKITEILPVALVPNFILQRILLRPLRLQTGGTILVSTFNKIYNLLKILNLDFNQLFLPIPNQYLDFQHHMSWSFFVFSEFS